MRLLDPGGLTVDEVLDAVAARSALRAVPYEATWSPSPAGRAAGRP